MEARLPMILSARRETVFLLGLMTAMSGASRASAADAPKGDRKYECISANERAQSLRTANKLVEASAQLAVCLDAACPGPVREDCTRLSGEIDAATPTIVLAAQDAAGNDIGAVQVTMDGSRFAEKLDGTAIPVNPGEHHFVFHAQGLPDVDKTVIVAMGAKNRFERVVFVGALLPTVPAPQPAIASTPYSGPTGPTSSPGPTAPGTGNTTPAGPPLSEVPQAPLPPHGPEMQSPGYGPGAQASATVRPVDRATSESGAAIPATALVVGGIGAAGLLVGTISGALALSKGSSLSSECTSGNTNCPSSAQGDISQLHTMQTLSSVGLGVGLAGVAIGAIIWLTSSPAERKTRSALATGWLGFGAAGASGSF